MTKFSEVVNERRLEFTSVAKDVKIDQIGKFQNDVPLDSLFKDTRLARELRRCVQLWRKPGEL